MAGTDQKGQDWTSLTVTKPMSDNVDMTVGTRLRFDDDFGGVAQLLLRPSVIYQLPNEIAATIGYLYFRNYPETGQTTNEHRPWEQIGHPLAGRANSLWMTGRTRLEQRFQQRGYGAVDWRVRQQLRFEAPLSRPVQIEVDRLEQDLSGAERHTIGARSGFEQTRTFFGLDMLIAPRIIFEPGYTK